MYKLILSKAFIKQLGKLDKYVANSILIWLEKHIDGTNNLRQQGKALVGNLKGLWRYRKIYTRSELGGLLFYCSKRINLTI